MLKQGLFISGSGEVFNVYSLELAGFYRLDICQQGAEFHTQPDKVCFSIVKMGKKTLVYGDRRLHQELQDHVNKVKFAKLPVHTEPRWEDGVYLRRQVRGTDDSFFSDTLEKAGRLIQETYRDGNRLFQIIVVDANSTLMLKPFNLHEYESIEIENEYVQKSPYVSLSILKMRYNLSHIERRDYKVVTDLEEARAFLQKVRESNELIGVDTETDSLEFNLYSTGKLVGVILSPTKEVSRYFPFGHNKFKNLPLEFLKEIEAVCLEIAEKTEKRDEVMTKYGILQSPGVSEASDGSPEFYGLGAHNKKFERKVFMKYGLDIPIKHDSMQMSIVANPILQKGAHALKPLVEEATGEKYLEFEDIFLDKDNINFADLDEDLVKFYACPDADNIRVVAEKEWKRLPKDSRFIYDLECKLADLKAEQEYWGWRIDAAKFIEGYNNTAKTITMLEDIIHILARWPDLKISSGDQLAELLYNRMKCKVYVRTNQDKPSTGARALRKLALEKRKEPVDVVKTDICDASGEPIIKASDLNKAKYPIVLVIEKYREYIKLMTAFYKRIEKNAVGHFSKNEDGTLSYSALPGRPCLRYFFWINQNGARTGRQSSPMHQLPKKIKAICLPDSSEHFMVGTDYSQIELRIFFSYAGEKEFIELCKDPSNDIHRIISSIISKWEMWQISQKIRSKDKQRNFGVVYLMAGKGLAVQKYGVAPTEEQVRECEESINDLFRTFKKLKKQIEANRQHVLKHGYMRTMFGRYAYFDRIFDPDLPKDKRESLIRQANNMPVQGTAADIMKIAEVKMRSYIKSKGWDKLVETPEGKFPLARVMISAHDEAVVSYHRSIPVEEILKMKRECMEMTIEGWAPLFGSSSVVSNWLEAKEDAYAIPIQLRDKLIEEYEKTGVSCCKSNDHKKEMVDIINKYRDEELVGYMESLIAQHGLDVDKVSSAVRHPSLTHELVARFKQTEEHRLKYGELSHEESIVYATGQYFEYRKGKTFELPKVEHENEKLDEEVAKRVMEEATGLAEEISYLDENGEVVYVDVEPDEPEEDALIYEGEAEDIQKLTVTEKRYIWEMFDAYMIDFEGLTIEECNEGLALIHSMSKPDGFSSIQLIYNEKIIDTGMRANQIDIPRIESFIKSKLELRSFAGKSL